MSSWQKVELVVELAELAVRAGIGGERRERGREEHDYEQLKPAAVCGPHRGSSSRVAVVN